MEIPGAILRLPNYFYGDKVTERHSTQLIDGDGILDGAGLENFVNAIKLGECGLSYSVVSVMGPQSSGKSTLLNHLFGTNFIEMDADEGRSQTTTGVWLANAVSTQPLVLAMDLEGNDGRERGQDAAFEKKIALFALAVSDVMLINMWCNDIGRENAANKPLLRTIFQVMLRLFASRKTTLMFVIRDKSKTPLQKLEAMLKADIQEIWDTVQLNGHEKIIPLSEYFNVEVVALSSYEYKENMFKDEVANLRRRLLHSINKGHKGHRKGAIPASGFSISCQQIWEDITENKDLDLPKHQELVAGLRCDQIANEVFSAFESDKEWCKMNEMAQSGPVPDFGLKLTAMIEASIRRYDSETKHYDENIRSSKQKELLKKLTMLFGPTLLKILGNIRQRAFKKLKEELENAVSRGENLDSAAQRCTLLAVTQFNTDLANAGIYLPEDQVSQEREDLQRDMQEHIAVHRRVKDQVSRERENRDVQEHIAFRLGVKDEVSRVEINRAVSAPKTNERFKKKKWRFAIKFCSTILSPFFGGLDMIDIAELIREWLSE